jgi:hypothetical protein
MPVTTVNKYEPSGKAAGSDTTISDGVQLTTVSIDVSQNTCAGVEPKLAPRIVRDPAVRSAATL